MEEWRYLYLKDKHMKIKLSKSQWEAVGQKAGWLKQAQSLITPTAPTSPTSGTGSDDDVHRRRNVKVTFSDGDYLETSANGTKNEILRYYMPERDGQGNPRGPDQDYDLANPEAVRHVVKVEFTD